MNLEYFPCPRCESTGTYNFKTCSLCNGRGKIPWDDLAVIRPSEQGIVDCARAMQAKEANGNQE